MSLKSLKSFFYEETETPSNAPSTPAPAEPAPVISNLPPAPGPSTAETQRIDQALQQKMNHAIEAAGIAGYKALDDMLDSLEDVVPDVNVRYKKALEICAKQGYTPAVLLNDIDRAIGVLEEESRVFEADQKRQFQSSVGALTRSVETLTQQITSKEAQMAALQTEILALRQKRDTDASAISSEQATIDHVNSRFTAVYQAIMKEVQAQRTAVEQRAKVQP
jgi:predicted  nucleic acid-binding Zn-ribbon protein